jgi:hypothetical protein
MGPRVVMDQFEGSVNVVPAVVVRGLSAEARSAAAMGGAFDAPGGCVAGAAWAKSGEVSFGAVAGFAGGLQIAGHDDIKQHIAEHQNGRRIFV